MRFSALILPLLILVLGPAGGRTPLLAAALCHALPLLRGLEGAAVALAYYGLLLLTGKPAVPAQTLAHPMRRLISYAFWRNLLRHRIFSAPGGSALLPWPLTVPYTMPCCSHSPPT